MADQTPFVQTSPVKRKGIKRLFIGTNVVIQIAVFGVLVIMANYFSFRHNRQFDCTRDQTFTLSGQTTTLLGALKKPVKAIVLIETLGPLRNDLEPLLREYEKHSDKKFRMELMSLYADPAKGKELVAKYKLGNEDRAVIILDYDGRHKFVSGNDLATYGAYESEKTGNREVAIVSFGGEAAITTKLLELVDDERSQVFYVIGHGEPRLGDPTIEYFHMLFQRQNGMFKQISLSDSEEIPAEAKAVIINGAKNDFSEREIELLNKYWEKNGRVFICNDPDAKIPNLDAWMKKQGVILQDDRVIKTEDKFKLDVDQRLVMEQQTVISPRAHFIPEGQVVTKDMAGRNTILLGDTQSIEGNAEMSKSGEVRYIPLIEAAEHFWGETNHVEIQDGKVLPVKEPHSDHTKQLILGLAVEKGGLADKLVKVEASRLVVVGNASVLDVEGMKVAAENNMYFGLNALNWLLDRKVGAGIPPKPKSTQILMLETSKIRNLSLATIICVPAIVAIFGCLVWWQRRY